MINHYAIVLNVWRYLPLLLSMKLGANILVLVMVRQQLMKSQTIYNWLVAQAMQQPELIQG